MSTRRGTLDQQRQPDPVRRRRTNGAAKALEALHTKRNKPLGLYYEDKISRELFQEEELGLLTQLAELEASAQEE